MKKALLVFGLALLTGCGGESGSSGSTPPPVSLAGDWHLVATQSNPVNDDIQIIVELHFNSLNEVTDSLGFLYQLSGLYYQGGAPCNLWPDQSVTTSSVNGQNVSLAFGDYQFEGEISNGSITGSFTTTCEGISGGSFIATSVGSIPASTFGGTTDTNSFEGFPIEGCPYQTIQPGILSSMNSAGSFSGQFTCTPDSDSQSFDMQGSQVGYAFNLSGTFGSTVAFFPPELPGTPVVLYLFDPQTGASGGSLILN